MIQAVKRYQASYQPLQLATGLRTIEARMILTLNDFGSLGATELEQRIGMADQDLHAALETLQRKQWIAVETADGEETLSLTDAGKDQAETLWKVANDRQQEVFGQFSEDELATFHKVLNAIQ